MRRLLNLLTILSLLGSLVVVVAWARSHFACDEFARARLTLMPDGHRSVVYQVRTWRGVLAVDVLDRGLKSPLTPVREYADALDLAQAEQRVAADGTWRKDAPAEFPMTGEGPFSRWGFNGSTVDESGIGRRLVTTRWSAPFWFLLLIASLPLDVGVIRGLRKRRVRQTCVCPTCGYDLRATPGRCPECGRTTSTS